MGRLKDGVTLEQADAALQTAWPAIMEATTSRNLPAERRAMFLGRKTALEPGRTGFSRVRNQFGEPLWLLMALVALLLVDCLRERGEPAAGARRRAAKGDRDQAGDRREPRARLPPTGDGSARPHALPARRVGLLLASWSGSALVASMRTSASRLSLDTSTGWRTLGFTLALAVAVSILSALLPALGATRRDVTGGLKDSGQPGASLFRRWSASKVLVAVQVALALVLLAGAAVFGRSLGARARAGIRHRERSAAGRHRRMPSPAGLDGAALDQFHAQLLDRLRAVPGVEAAALAWKPPISYPGGSWTQSIAVDGGPVTLSDTPSVYFNSVSPGYFATVGHGAPARPRPLGPGHRRVAARHRRQRGARAALLPRAGSDRPSHQHRHDAPSCRTSRSSASCRTRSTGRCRSPRAASPTSPSVQHAVLRSGSNRNLVAVARVDVPGARRPPRSCSRPRISTAASRSASRPSATAFANRRSTNG